MGQLVDAGAACAQSEASCSDGGGDDDKVVLSSLGLGREQVGLVLGDPFYLESHLGAFAGGGGTQWNNLVFWKHLSALRPLLSRSPPATILPSGASIFALGVEFASLRNPQEPVGLVEVRVMFGRLQDGPPRRPDAAPTVTACRLWLLRRTWTLRRSATSSPKNQQMRWLQEQPTTYACTSGALSLPRAKLWSSTSRRR